MVDDVTVEPMVLLTPVAEQLEELGVDYDVMDCDPAFADTAAFCERYGIAPEDSANAILIASKRPPGQYSVCVALATTKLDVNRRVRDLMEVRKLSFASADATRDVTGMEIGGVTPFGLADDLPVYVDGAVMDRDRIVLGGGNRSSKLLVAPDALRAIPSVVVVDDLATPL